MGEGVNTKMRRMADIESSTAMSWMTACKRAVLKKKDASPGKERGAS